MGQTVADFLLTRLSEWNVKRIYGYRGDGINELYVCLDAGRPGRGGDRLAVFQARPGVDATAGAHHVRAPRPGTEPSAAHRPR